MYIKTGPSSGEPPAHLLLDSFQHVLETDSIPDSSSDPSSSLSNSQLSSLTDSTNGQLSQSQISIKSIPHSSGHEPIPSQQGSLSNISNGQDVQTRHPATRNRDLQIATSILPASSLQSRSKPATLDASRSIGNEHKSESHGLKRTANGHVKSPSTSVPSSPINIFHRGHARNTSTASNGSQIGDVSVCELF